MEQLQKKDKEIEESGVFDSPRHSQKAKKEVNKKKSKFLNKNSKFYQFQDIEIFDKKHVSRNLSTYAQKGSKLGTPTNKQIPKSTQNDIFDFDFKSGPKLLKKNQSSSNLQKKHKTTLFGEKHAKQSRFADPFKTSNETQKNLNTLKHDPKKLKNFSMVNIQRRSEIQTTKNDPFNDFFSDIKYLQTGQLGHKRNKSTIQPSSSELLDLDFTGDKSTENPGHTNKYDFLDDISNQNMQLASKRKGNSDNDAHLEFI